MIYRHGECPAVNPQFCVKGSSRKVENLICSLLFWSIFALEWEKSWLHLSFLTQENKFIKFFTFFPEGFCSVPIIKVLYQQEFKKMFLALSLCK